jgi:hypothetical protein
MTEDAHELVCSRCGGVRDRPGQRYCRKCHNRAKRERDARLKQALAICKRAGLTIVATDSGFANVPVERMDATPRTGQTDD